MIVLVRFASLDLSQRGNSEPQLKGKSMSVYQPTYIDPKTGKKKTQKVWWYSFTYAGRRIQQSAKTTRKTLAKIAEKKHRSELEESYTGARASANEPMQRMRAVNTAIDEYVKAYDVNHADKSATWVKERAPHVKRLLGKLLVADITEQRLLGYMQQRLSEGVGSRTVNMEIDCLARAIGHAWKLLWPKLKRLDEPKDTGRALEPGEEGKLLQWAAKSRSPYMLVMLRIALLTGMRFGEISKLRWHQVDLSAGTISIGRTRSRARSAARVKTPASVRAVPLAPELYSTFANHEAFIAKKIGPIEPDWYVFPLCNSRRPIDAMRPVTGIKSAWTTVREKAGVECRFHDLRHTAYTKLIEAGQPEGVIEALMGHISKEMKERYSHVRMAAKREAVGNLRLDHSVKESTKVAQSGLLQ